MDYKEGLSFNRLKECFLACGNHILSFFQYAGGLSLLFVESLFWLVVPPFKAKAVFQQMESIGVKSFIIVFFISLFTGIVLALQTAYQLQRMSAEMYIASLVALSMTREFGPVLTALVVSGRCGAAIAAEIGTMKVTEQVDALQTLAVDPVKYLVVPRLVAVCIMLPVLTIYFNIVGMLGGYIIGVGELNISPSLYIKMSFDPLEMGDIFSGLFKAFIFGIIIAIVSCYEGLICEGGAEGVGRSTTRAVVSALFLILATNAILTALFYFVL